jgi:hypothetical protein
MKLILSRKGFDSQYGAGDSPILPDGRLLSLPIPSADAMAYRTVRSGYGRNTLASIITQLYGPDKLRRIGETCHLDPDIAAIARRRPAPWRGVLGQMGAAQGHLAKQGVGVGDLFLFFGRFRATLVRHAQLRFAPRSLPSHMVFGYLEVGEMLNPGSGAPLPRWLHYHPHVQARRRVGANNTLYLAADKLSLDPRLPGWGCLSWHAGLQLTTPGSRRISQWSLPREEFGAADISYHSPRSWQGDTFRAAARGQEFVVEADNAIQRWALRVIRHGSN